MNDHATTRLVNALEYVWQSIQANHPDVPDVVVTMGSGVHARGLKLGHFAKDSWAQGDSTVCELFIGGEGLQRGARGVLGTLLHEAAHGVAHKRDIQDTSRQGRYHNQHFKRIAQEVGIDVEQVPVIGWSKTTLPDATAVTYTDELGKLEEALILYRKGVVPNEDGTPAKRNTVKRVKVACPNCQRRVTFPLDDWEDGILHCVPCGEDYLPV